MSTKLFDDWNDWWGEQEDSLPGLYCVFTTRMYPHIGAVHSYPVFFEHSYPRLAWDIALRRISAQATPLDGIVLVTPDAPEVLTELLAKPQRFWYDLDSAQILPYDKKNG